MQFSDFVQHFPENLIRRDLRGGFMAFEYVLPFNKQLQNTSSAYTIVMCHVLIVAIEKPKLDTNLKVNKKMCHR